MSSPEISSAAPAWFKPPLTREEFMSMKKDDLQNKFIEIFTNLITPFWLRLSEIQAGKSKEAIENPESCIWYRNIYAITLNTVCDEIDDEEAARLLKARFNFFKNNSCFIYPMGNPKFWERDGKTAMGDYRNILVLKEAVSPSEAIHHLATDRISFLDCNQVIALAIYLVAIEILGSRAFDALVKSQGHRLIVGSVIDSSPYLDMTALFLRTLLQKGDISPTAPTNFPRGSICFIENPITSMIKKHEYGVEAGMNLISLGDNSYIGFGLNPGGVNLLEIGRQFCEDYNKDPVNIDLYVPSDYLSATATDVTYYKTAIDVRHLHFSPQKIKLFKEGILAPPPIYSDLKAGDWDKISALTQSQVASIRQKYREEKVPAVEVDMPKTLYFLSMKRLRTFYDTWVFAKDK